MPCTSTVIQIFYKSSERYTPNVAAKIDLVLIDSCLSKLKNTALQ